ncbi:zinc ABC transporter ATP-binding protein [Bacteroidia bacterium]|nr:zinc ABC transporter ATP-binding protein [Bacteroidia bacterium]
MNKILVEIEHLSAGYNQNIVLRDLSLKIYEHDFLGITGPNGGGKTTLIKVILGLLKPQSGEIRFASEALKNRTGYLPQTSWIDKQFPIVVSEVVASGLSSEKTLSKAQKKERVQAIIREMGLEKLSDRPIGQLSGGQLQRALLGRAIIRQPELLILDEPNSYLDAEFESHFYRLLEEMNRKAAIVLISHDIDAIRSMTKNVLIMN